MTELAKALPKSVLIAVDRYRALHGIRSRRTALEKLVQDAAQHPLEQALKNAEKLPKGSVSAKAKAQFEESRHLQAAGQENFVSLKEYAQRRKQRVHSS